MRNPRPLLIALALFSFSFLSAQVEVFDSDGTFTVPNNITLIKVECWGGGGGGGTSGPPGFGKGGGGGGAYSVGTFAVTPGQNYSMTIGLGGPPMTNGGATIFGANLVVAVGGAGSTGAAGGEGGKASACVGDLAYNGGNGAVSGMSVGGGGGGSAFSNADGGNGAGTTGGAGEGNGGDGGLQGNNPGAPGIAPGGGGGGKSGGMSDSGRGANGRVRVSYGSALPVTWLSFRAQPEGNDKVNLLWSTASESNNEGFSVQRSPNGRDWQTIAFVPGAGTTSEISNYSHTDNTLSTLNAPLIYYRLQQRDYDGATDYSPIRAVVIPGSDNGGVKLYPNPASESVTVAFAEPTEKRGTILFFDQHGRLVAEETLPPGTTEHAIRVGYLPAGMYVIRVVAGAQAWVMRVVVE